MKIKKRRGIQVGHTFEMTDEVPGMATGWLEIPTHRQRERGKERGTEREREREMVKRTLARGQDSGPGR